MTRRRLVLAVLPVLVMAGLLVIDRETAVLGLLSDDAFYYLKIGQAIASGRGSTFDGVAVTNGYHPLWMLCMVGISYLTGASLMAPVVTSMLLAAVLCGLTLTILHEVVERWAAPGFGLVAISACLCPLLLGAMTNGLETGILLLALALFLWCSYRYELLAPTAGTRSRLLLGLLLGLCFLCRLDSVFVGLSAGILVLASSILAGIGIRKVLLGCFAMACGAIIIVSPYLAWNYAAFGHLMPISGQVKSTFPALSARTGLYGDLEFGLAVVALDVLFAATVAYIDVRRGRALAAVLSSPLSILAVGVTGHLLYTLFFMSWGVYWWHFVAEGAALALGLAQFCDRISGNRPFARAATRLVLPGVVGLSGLGMQSYLAIDKASRHREWYAAAKWTRDHTEPDAVLAMKDAGLFAYFSQRNVINLDGKANSFAYLERLNRGEVRDYLREANVRYVADIGASYAVGRFPIFIPRASNDGLLLWMKQSDEIYHGESYSQRPFQSGSPEPARFAIWSFDGGR